MDLASMPAEQVTRRLKALLTYFVYFVYFDCFVYFDYV